VLGRPSVALQYLSPEIRVLSSSRGLGGFGFWLTLSAFWLTLAGCGGGGDDPPVMQQDGAALGGTAQTGTGDLGAAEGSLSEVSPAQAAFLQELGLLCGRAFRGEATLASPGAFDDGLTMHIRVCEEDEIQIPLHAGENRSRTWIVTRTAEGLRLKHDHRLEDGSDDPVTQYGGDTAEPGTPTQQSFPADAFTAELIPAAATNVWTMTIIPGERFVYHLTRDGEPRATFEFDLRDEVDPPPPPWGYEGS
jgi:hypothetical protein